MKSNMNDVAPILPQIYDPGPCEAYLEANKYYLLKDEQAFHPDGRLGGRKLTYINENLGLEVVVAWPSLTAQVTISGAGQICSPMLCLYEKPEMLAAFLMDAHAMRLSRQNPNQFKQ